MNFILDEKAYALWLIEHGTMGKSEKISIRILLKYYRHLGFAKEGAIEELVEFMRLNLPYFKPHEWLTLIENLATVVYEKEQDLVLVERIQITQSEMAAILSVSSFTAQKILYMLLIYKKIQNAISKQANDWFSGSLGELFKAARIGGRQSTVQAQCQMIYELKEAGLVELAKRLKNLNFRLTYLQLEPDVEQDPVVLEITNFSDVIYDFYHYLNHRVVRCQTCGKMIKLKKKERASRKYCTTCKQIAINEKATNYYYRQKLAKESSIITDKEN